MLNEVLPIHYLSVFYKRSRSPRDRYLKRQLDTSFEETTKIKNIQITLINQNSKNINNLDFTLRKRVKTQRKFHIKRDFSPKSEILPRRLKFIGKKTDAIRWRPFSMRSLNKQKNKSIEEILKELLAAAALKNKQSRYSSLKERQTNNLLRKKPLRRRVKRQTIRTGLRYFPKVGGVIWPGDYLKIELVKAPKLHIEFSKENNQDGPELKLNQNLNTEKFNLNNISNENTNKNILQPRKIQRKKKENIISDRIIKQEKKFNVEKHNVKVMKQKLKKSYHFKKTKNKEKKKAEYWQELDILEAEELKSSGSLRKIPEMSKNLKN